MCNTGLDASMGFPDTRAAHRFHFSSIVFIKDILVRNPP